MKVKAVVITKAGGPEVLELTDIELATPGPRDVLIRNAAIGVNHVDLHHRSGQNKVPGFPSRIGSEGAGIVEAVGTDVKEFSKGDRVAYFGPPLGSYAEAHVMPANSVVKLPEGIAFETAAAGLSRGMTAYYLLYRVRDVKPGEWILVQGATGGIGLILCQMGKKLGAKVIGTVNSDAKADLARANGSTSPSSIRVGMLFKRSERQPTARAFQLSTIR